MGAVAKLTAVHQLGTNLVENTQPAAASKSVPLGHMADVYASRVYSMYSIKGTKPA